MGDELQNNAPGAGAAGAGTPGGTGTLPASTGTPSQGGTASSGGAPLSTPPPGLSREDIAAVVGETVRNVLPQGGGQSEPPLTQEQIDAALRVFKPSAALLKRLRSENEEEAVQALAEMSQGIHNQATTLAQYILEQRMGNVLSQLGPLQTFVAEQQQERLKTEFFTEYPNLKGFDPILSVVRDGMVREGLKFKDKKSAFAECARRAQELLKTLPGAGGQGQGAQGTPAGTGTGTGTTPPSRMSTLTGGGQGGSGAGGGQQAPKPAWASLYEQ